MDLSDTNTIITVLCGVAIVVGIVGVIVPVLPGLLLSWLAVLVWAIFVDGGWGRWMVLAAATVLVAAATVIKYAWPGRNLKRSGVPNRSLIIGGLAGLVGFFVIPVVGVVVGFIAGVWAAERIRFGDWNQAWPSTREALKAAGLSMLIELGAALGTAVIWVIGLVAV